MRYRLRNIFWPPGLRRSLRYLWFGWPARDQSDLLLGPDRRRKIKRIFFFFFSPSSPSQCVSVLWSLNLPWWDPRMKWRRLRVPEWQNTHKSTDNHLESFHWELCTKNTGNSFSYFLSSFFFFCVKRETFPMADCDAAERHNLLPGLWRVEDFSLSPPHSTLVTRESNDFTPTARNARPLMFVMALSSSWRQKQWKHSC